MNRPRWIVAEVSKNWRAGVEVLPTGLLSHQFEIVINHNDQRGYRLQSFAVDRRMVGADEMNETLIAVFVDARTRRAPKKATA
jgi:hypothetical protein